MLVFQPVSVSIVKDNVKIGSINQLNLNVEYTPDYPCIEYKGSANKVIFYRKYINDVFVNNNMYPHAQKLPFNITVDDIKDFYCKSFILENVWTENIINPSKTDDYIVVESINFEFEKIKNQEQIIFPSSYHI